VKRRRAGTNARRRRLGAPRDVDLQSDRCLRIATLNDLTAEWTGGFFDRAGRHFYASIQHNKSGDRSPGG